MDRHVSVVTGGSRGIGAATCRRLAAAGHDVVLGFRAAEAAAEATADAVRATGVRCVAVRMDTTNEGDVDRLFDAAAEIGPVTCLVNNAGITGPVGRLVDIPSDELLRVFEVDVVGYLLCARRAARDMSGRGGAIVNVSSAAATLGSPGEYVHYAGAKAAVDAVTVGLAKELAADGIRVNAVAPGTVWTDIHADPERPAKVAATIPMGRSGDPDEIAAAICWLLSAEASYTTGAILRVSGGR
ncbi:MAG TPA: SDR family oxidoreductase [Nocardioidaceae bacterium]|nr:SDR family oxidoreductase [Nocardioidaceae bacterium]